MNLKKMIATKKKPCWTVFIDTTPYQRKVVNSLGEKEVEVGVYWEIIDWYGKLIESGKSQLEPIEVEVYAAVKAVEWAIEKGLKLIEIRNGRQPFQKNHLEKINQLAQVNHLKVKLFSPQA